MMSMHCRGVRRDRSVTVFSVTVGGGWRTEPRLRRAFTLLEVLVAVAILAVIVVGLLATFYQTQRAFRTGLSQGDVLEGGRGTLQLLARELQEMYPSQITNVYDFVALTQLNEVPQDLPGGQLRTNYLQEITFVSRYNDTWSVTAYHVSDFGLGVGALYRTNVSGALTNLPAMFDGVRRWSFDPEVEAKVVDGVVHFRFTAYDENGILIPEMSKGSIRGYCFPDLGLIKAGATNILPAYLELELGILEPKAMAKFQQQAEVWLRNPPTAPTMARTYLADKAKQVHLFRQRIPVRTLPALQTAVLSN